MFTRSEMRRRLGIRINYASVEETQRRSDSLNVGVHFVSLFISNTARCFRDCDELRDGAGGGGEGRSHLRDLLLRRGCRRSRGILGLFGRFYLMGCWGLC